MSQSWGHKQIDRNDFAQVTLSRNGKILLTCCDDGTIWRWDRVSSNIWSKLRNQAASVITESKWSACMWKWTPSKYKTI